MNIRILECILISIFYLAYFAKQVMLRRKGINTNRLAKGNKPKKTATIETCLLLTTYGSAVIQYLSIFTPKYLIPISLPIMLNYVGVAITGIGVVFFILAITHMKDSWRAGIDEEQDTSIVTNGIYQLSRNPAFVGFDLLYIGIFLAVPNVVMFLAAVISVVLMHLQILEEEKYLPTVFGKTYLKYKEKTRRYF